MSNVNQDLDVAFSDFHFPFHDPVCVRLTNQFVSKFQPKEIHLLGDILDFYSISHYRRDPKRRQELQREIDQAVVYLRRLRALAPDSVIYLHEGNHEERLYKYLCDHAQELAGLRALSLPALLELDKLEIYYQSTTDPLRNHDLWLVHGTVVRKHAGYSARAMLEKVGGDVLFGHTHRLGVSHITDWGRTISAWENGCLCLTSPEYVIGKPNWQQGFHAIQWHGRRHNVEPVQIHGNWCSFRGVKLTTREAA